MVSFKLTYYLTMNRLHVPKEILVQKRVGGGRNSPSPKKGFKVPFFHSPPSSPKQYLKVSTTSQKPLPRYWRYTLLMTWVHTASLDPPLSPSLNLRSISLSNAAWNFQLGSHSVFWITWEWGSFLDYSFIKFWESLPFTKHLFLFFQCD